MPPARESATDAEAQPRVPGDDEYVDTVQLASVLKMSRSYFEKLRWRGGGPPYLKFSSRVLYRFGDVRAWLPAHVRCQTSHRPRERRADTA